MVIDGRKVSQDKFIEKEINSKKFEGFMLYNTTSYLILERNTINDNQKFTCQLEPLFPSLKSQNITFVTKLISKSLNLFSNCYVWTSTLNYVEVY